MGNQQPITNPGTDNSITSSPNIVPEGYFGVRVSGPALNELVKNERVMMKKEIDEAIEKAYQKGKDEGAATLQADLAKFSSIVFQDVQTQLDGFYEQQVKVSSSLSEKIDSQLAPIKPLNICCKSEKENLKVCLSNLKSKSSLECATYVTALSSCATEAVKEQQRQLDSLREKIRRF